MDNHNSVGTRKMHPLTTRVQPHITHNHTAICHVWPRARTIRFCPTGGDVAFSS